jgi:hypothetical protein
VSRFLLAAILIATAILPSQGAEPAFTEGQNFYRARAALLRDGWQPVVIFHKDFEHMDPSGSGDVDLEWIYAKPFWRHGFKEIASCSGMEGNYCNFNYRKEGRCLFVVTAGVYPGMVSLRNWWTYPTPAKGNCSYDTARAAMERFPHRTFIHSVP